MKEKKPVTLILVRSVTYAQAVMRALRSAGVYGQVQRAPRSISDRGCGYAVAVRDPVAAMRALFATRLPTFRMYQTHDGVNYFPYR